MRVRRLGLGLVLGLVLSQGHVETGIHRETSLGHVETGKYCGHTGTEDM